MKPPIEYRPKKPRVEIRQSGQRIIKKLVALVPMTDELLKPEPEDFIVIRRDRAKYNAYMRAYRAKKKLERK